MGFQILVYITQERFVFSVFHIFLWIYCAFSVGNLWKIFDNSDLKNFLWKTFRSYLKFRTVINKPVNSSEVLYCQGFSGFYTYPQPLRLLRRNFTIYCSIKDRKQTERKLST